MKPMSNGELDTPLEFYTRTEEVDEAGGVETTWTSKAFFAMAKEETGASDEDETSDQDAAFARVVWWIRRRAGVSVTMRVLRDGQWFDVKAVVNVGRKSVRWIKVLGEMVNDG